MRRAQVAGGGEGLEVRLSIGDLIRGAIAGAIGTLAMDLVTQMMVDHTPRAVTRREEAAMPEGKPAAQLAAEKSARLVGVELSEDAAKSGGSVMHWATGVLPAALFYGLAAKRLAPLGPIRGMVFALGLWAVLDEGANPVLGLSSPPGDCPIETHVRGLVGHVVLGAVTEATYSALHAIT